MKVILLSVPLKILLVRAGCAFALTAGTRAAVFTVISGADSGPGTLREAIGLAGAAAGADTVDFAPGSFPAGGTVNLTAGLTIPAAGDTAGVTLATAVPGGKVDVAVNLGALGFGPGGVWTGGGRIFLGDTSGSGDAMVDLTGNDGGTTLAARLP